MESLVSGGKVESDFCAQHGIPLAIESPQERLRSLLAYRNDRRLFRRQCDASGELLISAYHPECDFRIVRSDIWWGDGWDGLEFGFSPDPAQCFFPQFHELQKRVPREGTSVVNAENCDYNSHCRESKNCYLCHLAFRCEDTMYSYWSVGCRDLIEGSYCAESTLCYACRNIVNCYNCIRLHESSNCNDCFFSTQLRNCANCLFCANLVGKTYYLWNKPCSREEFERARTQLLDGTPAALEDAEGRFHAFSQRIPVRAQHSLNSVDGSGEHLVNCKNCIHCFDVRDSEDCFNHTNGIGRNIIHGYSVGFPLCESVYSSVTARNSSDIFFCSNTWSSNNLWYCDNCVNCRDCFGCVGLKQRQNCFFNQQLSPDDYAKQTALWRRLMTERGEFSCFFPIRLSPFAYNESAAQDFFPLTQHQIEANGWQFREPPSLLATPDSVLRAPRLEALRGGEVLLCETCNRPYRIIAKELEFYRAFKLPIPADCPECRLNSRLAARNPYQLIARRCSQCGQQIETVYSEDIAREVVCDPCFHELVV